MAKVLHTSLEELTLCCVYFEPMLPQLLKHLLKPSEVVYNAVAVHDDVIQVHQEDLQQVLAEDSLHQSLKMGRCIAQSKGHLIVLKQAHWCGTEGFYHNVCATC